MIPTFKMLRIFMVNFIPFFWMVKKSPFDTKNLGNTWKYTTTRHHLEIMLAVGLSWLKPTQIYTNKLVFWTQPGQHVSQELLVVTYIVKTILHQTKNTQNTTHWLVVSTHLKNISQIGSFPQVGVKIKNV